MFNTKSINVNDIVNLPSRSRAQSSFHDRCSLYPETEHQGTVHSSPWCSSTWSGWSFQTSLNRYGYDQISLKVKYNKNDNTSNSLSFNLVDNCSIPLLLFTQKPEKQICEFLRRSVVRKQPQNRSSNTFLFLIHPPAQVMWLLKLVYLHILQLR